MDKVVSQRNELLAKKVIKNLESRKFEAYYCKTKEEALDQLLALIPEGSLIGWGGSLTLQELGVFEALRGNKYELIDRETAKDADERFEMMRSALLSDVFLMSSNALSEDGILVNVDGNGNRLAALTFGPKSVVVVVGMNKVVKTKEDAYHRARTIAAPINTQRFSERLAEHEKMPCLLNGSCADCTNPNSICNSVVETRMSNTKGRIKVILVNEELGF